MLQEEDFITNSMGKRLEASQRAFSAATSRTTALITRLEQGLNALAADVTAADATAAATAAVAAATSTSSNTASSTANGSSAIASPPGSPSSDSADSDSAVAIVRAHVAALHEVLKAARAAEAAAAVAPPAAVSSDAANSPFLAASHSRSPSGVTGSANSISNSQHNHQLQHASVSVPVLITPPAASSSSEGVSPA
jgi:trimeric autotransporter adhesin